MALDVLTRHAYGGGIVVHLGQAHVEASWTATSVIRAARSVSKRPFRWAALSGDPQDIAATDDAVLELFPENESLARWIRMARTRVQFQGLPARICWLGLGERAAMGLRINEMVRTGRLSAPAIGLR